MVRTRRGNVATKRRKKYLKLAKGFVGSNSKLATLAGEQVVQSLNFAYIGRRFSIPFFCSLSDIEVFIIPLFLSGEGCSVNKSI